MSLAEKLGRRFTMTIVLVNDAGMRREFVASSDVRDTIEATIEAAARSVNDAITACGDETFLWFRDSWIRELCASEVTALVTE